MFALLLGAIVLELLASMGTFGALVAQNLFTNSAAGWYVRLDWTAVYAYAVSILSVIVTLCLALGGLTRGASGNRGCGFLFNPFGIFITGFVFSILWVVIAGFAYRNPLPMHYPCDIFRHLRYSLEMLGMASGKSLIEEGGLLVGICQSSKAFLVLAGIGLGLWIFIMVSSCAAMATGLGPKKKQAESKSSRSSVRSALSRLRRHGMTAQQLPVPATYPEPGAPVHPIARTPSGLAYPPQATVRDQNSGTAEPRYQNKRQAAYHPKPRPAPAAQNKPRQAAYQCPPNCTFHGPMYQTQHSQPASANAQPVRQNNVEAAAAPEPTNTATREANLDSAFASGGYSRDISPRPVQPHQSHTYGAHSPHKPPTNPIDDDSRELDHGADHHDMSYVHDKHTGYAVQYSPDDGHEYDDNGYMHHHAIPPHPHSPDSNPSRRQRLRQIFSRDANEHS